ncbi:hypothetical protein [Bacillus stercoris]|uniref:hypothetical protein n=1 Tax=Bacillus stercoris TaxID=2054641 RepID=UPI003CF40AA2
MYKIQKGYLLKDVGRVVTDKAILTDVKDEDFEEVLITLRMSEIKDWAEEIDMLGLDEEDVR